MNDQVERDEAISAAYRGLPPEPIPGGIDAAVMSAGRASVASPRRRNWVVPASFAAVLALAVVVSVRMERERPQVATMESLPPAAKSQPSPSPQPNAPVVTPQPPRTEVKPAAPADTLLSSPTGGSSVGPTAPSREHREPARREPRARIQAAKSVEKSKAGQTVPRPVPPSQAKTAPEPAAASGSPVAEPEQAPSHTTAESPSASESTAPTLPEAAKPASPARDPTTLAAASPPAAAQAQDRSPKAAEEATTGKSVDVDRGLAENEEEPPEVWLERIAGMRAQGRRLEADTNLAEFRKIYPSYRIAPEVREKVERPRVGRPLHPPY